MQTASCTKKSPSQKLPPSLPNASLTRTRVGPGLYSLAERRAHQIYAENRGWNGRASRPWCSLAHNFEDIREKFLRVAVIAPRQRPRLDFEVVEGLGRNRMNAAYDFVCRVEGIVSFVVGSQPQRIGVPPDGLEPFELRSQDVESLWGLRRPGRLGDAQCGGRAGRKAERTRRESFSRVLSPQLTVAVSSAAQWFSARGLTSNVGGSTKPKSRGVQPWFAKHVSAALTKLGSSRC